MSGPPAADGLDDLARVVARDEIRQLAYRYAAAIDARDLDLLVSLFVPNVRVGRDRTGHDALRASFEQSLSGIGVSILLVGNHLIDFESPERASGSVYCVGRIQEGDRFIEQAIRYDDTYARHGGAWRFVRRIHRLWYGVETATNPLDQPPANWPERATGRGTLPEALPTWNAFWADRGRGPGER